MLPGIVGQNYQSFHEINLVLPFLAFAFYFFSKERFRPFMVMFIIGLTVKEDVALSLFMFAPYAIIKKKPAHWYLVPAIVSISWILLSINLIIPYFNKSHTYGVGIGYLGNMGSSIPEIASNIVGKPLSTLRIMFDPEKCLYIFYLLLPIGLILPFFSAEILFAVPSIVLNLLPNSGRFRLAGFTVGSDQYYLLKHMSLMACTFAYIALIYSIKNISSSLPDQSKKITACLVLMTTMLISYNDRFMLIKYLYHEDENLIHYLPSAVSIKKILSKIPYTATVTSDRSIASHLYDRKEAYYDFNDKITSDYLVLTRMDFESIHDHAYIDDTYNLIDSDENIGLFKRKHR